MIKTSNQLLLLPLRIILCVALSCLILVPGTSMAKTEVQTGESVVIATSETFDNFYTLAGEAVHAGTIEGDLYAVAGTLTAQGPIETDLTVLSGRVDVDGDVGDDVRVIAGEVQIAGAVAGDVFVIGGRLNVLPSASVAGDIFFFGGEAEINGPVTGSIVGHAERVRIDTSVGSIGLLTARQQLSLGAQTSVAGDVEYRSSRELIRAPETVIEGEVKLSPIPVLEDTVSFSDRVLPFLIMLFGSLVLYLAGRSFMSAVVEHALTHSLRSSFIGVALAVAGPFVALFLLATVLGLVIGLGALGILIIVLALSYSVAPMVLGVLLWRLAGGALVLQPFAILLGVAVLQVFMLVPFIGLIIVTGLSVIAAGALADVALRRLRRR